MIGRIHRATWVAVLVPGASNFSVFFKDCVGDTKFAKLDGSAQARGTCADDDDVNIVCLCACPHLVLSDRSCKVKHLLITDLQAHLLKQHWYVGFRNLFTNRSTHHFLYDLA